MENEDSSSDRDAPKPPLNNNQVENSQDNESSASFTNSHNQFMRNDISTSNHLHNIHCNQSTAHPVSTIMANPRPIPSTNHSFHQVPAPSLQTNIQGQGSTADPDEYHELMDERRLNETRYYPPVDTLFDETLASDLTRRYRQGPWKSSLLHEVTSSNLQSNCQQGSPPVYYDPNKLLVPANRLATSSHDFQYNSPINFSIPSTMSNDREIVSTFDHLLHQVTASQFQPIFTDQGSTANPHYYRNLIMQRYAHRFLRNDPNFNPSTNMTTSLVMPNYQQGSSMTHPSDYATASSLEPSSTLSSLRQPESNFSQDLSSSSFNLEENHQLDDQTNRSSTKKTKENAKSKQSGTSSSTELEDWHGRPENLPSQQQHQQQVVRSVEHSQFSSNELFPNRVEEQVGSVEHSQFFSNELFPNRVEEQVGSMDAQQRANVRSMQRMLEPRPNLEESHHLPQRRVCYRNSAYSSSLQTGYHYNPAVSSSFFEQPMMQRIHENTRRFPPPSPRFYGPPPVRHDLRNFNNTRNQDNRNLKQPKSKSEAKPKR